MVIDENLETVESTVPSEPTEVTVNTEGEFQDRDIACRECGAAFTFTSGEQAFYQSRGFAKEPTRCPECRNSRRGRKPARGEEETSRVVCAACGVITTVPFRPSGGKPVYCRDCYAVRS